MKYDKDKHEILDCRQPEIGEQIITINGDIITVERNSIGEPRHAGNWPIVRERVHDLRWALCQMLDNPMVEYRGVEDSYRWNPTRYGFEVHDGRWLLGHSQFTDDEINSTSWHRVDAEPQPEPLTPEALTAEVHTLRDEVRRLREKVEGA